MAYKYKIETRKLEGEKIESKINNGRSPMKENQIAPLFQQLYQETIKVHEKAIKLLGLEKVTTKFCEANME